MKTNIVRIGNSKGIRIPKTILKQCHLGEDVELEPRENELVIKSLEKTRKGWAEAFGKMAVNKDDALLDPASITPWDKTEWKW